MTTQQPRDPLALAYTAFVEDLATGLDLTAGAEDAAHSAPHHDEFTTDLLTILDIDAGLANIIGGDIPPTPPAPPRPGLSSDEDTRPDRVRHRSGVDSSDPRPSRPLLPARGLAMVMTFREIPSGLPIQGNLRRMLWALVVLDVMVVAWMLSAGAWLDRVSLVTAVVTLGGHHLVVLWLAGAGFALLGGTALLTGGFTVVRRRQMPFLVLSPLVSVIANAGVLWTLLVVVMAVLLVALVGAAFLGRRGTAFLSSFFRW